MAELVGIADGDDEVAHRQLLRVAERQRGEIVGVDLQQSDVGLRIAAHQLGGELAAILERHRDLVRVVDDVVVGDDVALVGVNDDASAGAAPRHLATAKEPPEGRIVEQRMPGRTTAGHLDVDHCRRNALEHRRERELAIVGGGGAACCGADDG